MFRLKHLLLVLAGLALCGAALLFVYKPTALANLMAQAQNITVAEYPAGPLPDNLIFDRLLLEKGKRRLTAYANGAPARIYTVALGTNPIGHKEFQGDRKTPEGLYKIDGKNPNSSYHKNLGVSYPNDQDRAKAAELGKAPGGDIKIHGLRPKDAYLGKAHRLTDWTHGCIAVTNEEMDELYARTPVGIPIEILP